MSESVSFQMMSDYIALLTAIRCTYNVRFISMSNKFGSSVSA